MSTEMEIGLALHNGDEARAIRIYNANLQSVNCERVLLAASRYGSAQLVEVVADQVDDVNSLQTSSGDNAAALLFAGLDSQFTNGVADDDSIMQKYADTVQALANAGFDFNQTGADGYPYIHKAAMRNYNNIEIIVDAMLNSGVSPNTPNNRGDLPMSSAVTYDNILLAQCLLSHGASPNHNSEEQGNFAVSPLVRVTLENNTLFAKVLISAGATTEGQDYLGMSLPYLASIHENTELYELVASAPKALWFKAAQVLRSGLKAGTISLLPDDLDIISLSRILEPFGCAKGAVQLQKYCVEIFGIETSRLPSLLQDAEVGVAGQDSPNLDTDLPA